MKYFTLLISIIFSLFITNQALAITNGMLASDVIGQYEDNNEINPVGVFTKGGLNNGPNEYGFNFPRGLAFDGTNHRFFVSDSLNNRVLVYNLNEDNTFPDRIADNVLGQSDFTTATTNTTQDGMNNPYGLAYDSINNRLFVADYLNNRVLIFDTNTITNGEPAINVLGQSDFITATANTTQNGLNGPHSLAYDSTNNRLFVSDNINNRVLVFDTTTIENNELATNVIGQTDFITATASTTISTLNAPTGIAYDDVNKRLFVGQSGNFRVTVYSVDPTVLIPNVTNGPNAINVLGQTTFTGSTAGTTQSKMRAVFGVFYEPISKKLFVSQTTSGSRVTIYNADPAVLIPNTPATDGANAIAILGQTLYTTSTLNTTQSSLTFPTGMTYDSINNKLFIAQQGLYSQRISIFDISSITNGEDAIDLLGQYGDTIFTSNPIPVYTNPTANGVNKLGFYAVGMTLDNINHRAFVSNLQNNRVLVYNLNENNTFPDKIPDYVLGQPNFYSSARAITATGMNGPASMLYIDDEVTNKLFVSDNTNNRVLVFDTTTIENGEPAINVLGQPDFTTGTANTTQSGMAGASPSELFYDINSSKLFVMDGGNNRILIFDLSDTTITSISAPSDTYQRGDTVPISVNFSKVINVTGTPTLTLETGDIDQIASYDSGSGTDTLIFNYEVQREDEAEDLDYISTDALSLNGGTILDLYNGLPIFTLPTPGETGSLSNTSDVRVVIPHRTYGSYIQLTNLPQQPIIPIQFQKLPLP